LEREKSVPTQEVQAIGLKRNYRNGRIASFLSPLKPTSVPHDACNSRIGFDVSNIGIAQFQSELWKRHFATMTYLSVNLNFERSIFEQTTSIASCPQQDR
jgi:hypothetical protein